jgi:hypothetical protein
MFLIGHAAVGIALASVTTNPAAAFGIGWLSHYLADFLPHGDEELGEWTKRGNEVLRLLAFVSVDGAIMLAALAAYFHIHGFSWPVLAAAFGSTTPDVMWGLEKLCKRKLFGFHERFHCRNHNFFQVRMPLAAGIAVQALVTSLLWSGLIG